jgi:hypothetical protein
LADRVNGELGEWLTEIGIVRNRRDAEAVQRYLCDAEVLLEAGNVRGVAAVARLLGDRETIARISEWAKEVLPACIPPGAETEAPGSRAGSCHSVSGSFMVGSGPRDPVFRADTATVMSFVKSMLRRTGGGSGRIRVYRPSGEELLDDVKASGGDLVLVPAGNLGVVTDELTALVRTWTVEKNLLDQFPGVDAATLGPDALSSMAEAEGVEVNEDTLVSLIYEDHLYRTPSGEKRLGTPSGARARVSRLAEGAVKTAARSAGTFSVVEGCFSAVAITAVKELTGGDFPPKLAMVVSAGSDEKSQATNRVTQYPVRNGVPQFAERPVEVALTSTLLRSLARASAKGVPLGRLGHFLEAEYDALRRELMERDSPYADLLAKPAVECGTALTTFTLADFGFYWGGEPVEPLGGWGDESVDGLHDTFTRVGGDGGGVVTGAGGRRLISESCAVWR